MKSQAIPKEQTHPVKMIVANNYDTEIHKIKKDAVLFIHAPWCGHCKEFDPVRAQFDLIHFPAFMGVLD